MEKSLLNLTFTFSSSAFNEWTFDLSFSKSAVKDETWNNKDWELCFCSKDWLKVRIHSYFKEEFC